MALPRRASDEQHGAPVFVKRPALSLRFVLPLLGLLAVLVPLATIWVPEYLHYRVPPVRTYAPVARAMLAPLTTAVCSEFAVFSFASNWDAPEDELRIAQLAAARHELIVPGYERATFTPTFDATEFLHGYPSFQLNLSMLLVPQLLVGAYEQTGNIAALRDAKSYLQGWWRFERETVFPRALQWNDHAVAGRVYPLTRFLCAASKAQLLSDEETAEIISALLTTGTRLLKSDFFTYRTNHGTMQIAALLHLAAAFPDSPLARDFASAALERLTDQLGFYLSEEGVVLEHSAGYHAFGVHVLSIIARYLQELGLPLPERLQIAYPRMLRFLDELRRPDGTLPAWGNTGYRTGLPLASPDGSLSRTLPLARYGGNCEKSIRLLAPASGVAVWWDRTSETDCGRERQEQTLVVWANFPSRAHKHIDEMSVRLWTNGLNLLTGSGYWPYSAAHLDDAVGWASGNGPRFQGEQADRRGDTLAVSHASGPAVEYIQLERRPADGGRLRREVVYLRPGRWLLIDSAEAGETKAGRSLEFHLTFDAAAQVRPASADGTFDVLTGDTSRARIAFLGCEGGSTRLLKGSTQPFMGWSAADGAVRPAYAILRQCPAGMLSMVAIERIGDGGPLPLPRAATANAGQWVAWLGGQRVERTAEQLLVQPAEQARQPSGLTLKLTPFDRASSATEAIGREYRRVAAKYDRYMESWQPWRVKASYAILSMAGAQTVLATALSTASRRRRRLATLNRAVAVAAFLFWIGLAGWLQFVYFA
jgi:hypothetical protein